MKKFFTLLIGCILCAAAGQAQDRVGDSFTVTGQVVDSLTNEPIPFATVAFAFDQTPNKYVNAVACDGNGKFEINLKDPGNYVMTIQSVEITTLMKPITLAETNKKVDVGKIFVQEKTQTIKEVTISAQRPLVSVEIEN